MINQTGSYAWVYSQCCKVIVVLVSGQKKQCRVVVSDVKLLWCKLAKQSQMSDVPIVNTFQEGPFDIPEVGMGENWNFSSLQVIFLSFARQVIFQRSWNESFLKSNTMKSEKKNESDALNRNKWLLRDMWFINVQIFL